MGVGGWKSSDDIISPMVIDVLLLVYELIAVFMIECMY